MLVQEGCRNGVQKVSQVNELWDLLSFPGVSLKPQALPHSATNSYLHVHIMVFVER